MPGPHIGQTAANALLPEGEDPVNVLPLAGHRPHGKVHDGAIHCAERIAKRNGYGKSVIADDAAPFAPLLRRHCAVLDRLCG